MNMAETKSQYDAAMASRSTDTPNVRLAVPFFCVKDIQASLRFYIEGLGFTMTRQWTPQVRIRWCWIELGSAAVMLQEYWKDGHPGGWPAGPFGQGVSICFMCADALAIYHEARARGLDPSRPFVGNNLWVTSLVDPDGFRLEFESPTDVAEDTVYSDEA
jgi:lactoylglutathione lyase